MNAELLNKIGEALYGAHATSGLCEAFDVSPRAMRRWLNGTNEIPPRLTPEARRLLADKIATLTGLLRDIEQID